MSIARRGLGLLTLTFSSLASAAPIVFTYSSTGSGTIGSTSFTNTPFTITAHADTLDWIQFTPTFFEISHLSASIALDGIGTFDFIAPTNAPFGTWHNTSSQKVAFTQCIVFAFGCGMQPVLDGPANSGLGTWDRISSIGPLVGPGLFPPPGFAVFPQTTGGFLRFTIAPTEVTFTATIPEPATGISAIAGIATLLAICRIRRSDHAHRQKPVR